MSTKTNNSKVVSKSGEQKKLAPVQRYKQDAEELEKSIILMVLSNPRLELEIVGNYLDRNGYAVVSNADADKSMAVHGIHRGRESLTLRAKMEAEAKELYKSARELKAKIGKVSTRFTEPVQI